eukprot:560608-Rhodomonas_salina.9
MSVPSKLRKAVLRPSGSSLWYGHHDLIAAYGMSALRMAHDSTEHRLWQAIGHCTGIARA